MKAEADPNLIVYFGGGFVPLHEARVGILTHALHYGTGVFEGIRAYWDEPQQELFVMRPHEHLRAVEAELRHSADRSSANAGGIMRHHAGVDAEKFLPHQRVCPSPGVQKCRAGRSKPGQSGRVRCHRASVWRLPAQRGRAARGHQSWRRIDDNAIPARAKICGAYVNSALASDEARHRGFDEAILLNESGHVAEGSTCNIFMVRKGKLITPPVTENVLEGITRDSVSELALRELGLHIEERAIDRSELYVCDELFFTGTAVGIEPVVKVDHRAVGGGNVGPVTTQLRQLYFDATRGHLQNYRHWLMPVHGTPNAQLKSEDWSELIPMVS